MCKVMTRYTDDLGGRGGQRRAKRTEEEDTDLKPNLVNLAPSHPGKVSSPPTVRLCVHVAGGGGGKGKKRHANIAASIFSYCSQSLNLWYTWQPRVKQPSPLR